MLSNERTLAVVILTLFLLQGLPLTAAQTFTSADLIVTDVTTTSAPMLNTLTEVRVTVKNQGTQNSGGLGFVVAVYEGPGTACLDRNDNPQDERTSNEVDPTQGCRQRSTQGLAPGASATFSFRWTPTGTQRGTLDVRSSIEPHVEGGAPPDDAASFNNKRSHDNIFVISPAVRVLPDRDLAPISGADENTAWRTANITQSCDTTPNAVIRIGCIARPGQAYLFNFKVINDGNAQDVFTPSLNGVDTLKAAKWNFTFSSTALPTAPGKTRTVGLIIEVPFNSPSGTMLNVNTATATVGLTSSLDPRVTTTTGASLPSLLVGDRYGVNLTFPKDKGVLPGNGGDQVTFNVGIENFGNVRDTYRLRFIHDTGAPNMSINGSWSLPGSMFVSVDPYTHATAALAVTVPMNATTGHHSIRLEAESVNDDTGDYLRNVTLTVDVQQRRSISGIVETGLVSRVPAEEATFVLNITNLGNGLDNVTLRMDPLPSGWTGALSTNLLRLAPFSAGNVWLNVTPPPNAPRAFEGRIWVNATSDGPRDVAPEQRAKTQPLVSTVRITEGSNLIVQGGGASAFVDAGNKSNFTLRVTNTGNVQDNFTIHPTKDNAAWGVQAVPAYIVLRPLESGDVNVVLTAPSTATVGDTASVLTAIRSSVDTSRERSVSLSGRVSGPDLFVDRVISNATNPYAGDPLEISVVFGNSGNKVPPVDVSLRLVHSQNGVETPIGERMLKASELRGGIRLTERFTWTDNVAAEGTGILIARIDPEGAVVEIDDSVTSNEASLPITLRTFDIRVKPAEGLSGRPGEKVTYQDPNAFIVEYRGNQPSEPVKITIESANGWGRSETTTSLVRGNEQRLGVELIIPAFPGVAEDTITLTVTPTLRTGAIITASAKTVVLDDEKPTIEAVTATPGSVVFGANVTIGALVRDATGLRSVRAFIVSPDNQTTSILLSKGTDDTWTGARSFTFAGLYRYYIEAVDGSNLANENSTREKASTFTVTPGSAPIIELSQGQGTVIRSGNVIRFNITDPLGVGAASYTIKNISYALPRPFHVDTASFPNGPIVVTVTASNIYGAESSKAFTFEVDNTPPGIREVTAEPAVPKINEETTLRILTDDNVESVEVTVRRDGQVVDTIKATKLRDGVFEAKFTPEQGNYNFDVSARDLAGNTQTRKDAVLFSAKPASIIPGPGLALVAVALVGIALVLRRRA